jgi:hypothetical protein
VSAGLHTVHVRVNDAATDQPTPCRIRFTDAAGTYYAPLGRLTKFATGDNEDVGGNLLLYPGKIAYAYIDGTCEIRLPAGTLTVEIHKGPEYRPLRQEFHLPAGKLALRFVLERWTDLRRERWYSGDIRAHALTPHAALLEGAAEDLAVVNLLARVSSVYGEDWNFNWHSEGDDPTNLPEPPVHTWPAIENILSFSGQRPALEMPGHMVVVNTYNRHEVLGHLGLLNCHRVVYPLRCDDTEEFADWTLSDWCDQCHRKKGLVVGVCDACDRRGEELADVILEKIDALEAYWQFPDESAWHPLFSAGVRFAIVGGSGKIWNTRQLGKPRTYARLREGEELTYENWIEAVRAGRTFATEGPLLQLRVNGHDPGTALETEAGQRLRVSAAAQSLVPFDCLEVLANGTVVSSQRAGEELSTASLEGELELPEGGWIAARCRTTRKPRPGMFDKLFSPVETTAHTSPVFVRVKGKPVWVDPAQVEHVLDLLKKFLRQLHHCYGGDEPAHYREDLRGIFQAAENVLRRRLQQLPPEH